MVNASPIKTMINGNAQTTKNYNHDYNHRKCSTNHNYNQGSAKPLETAFKTAITTTVKADTQPIRHSLVFNQGQKSLPQFQLRSREDCFLVQPSWGTCTSMVLPSSKAFDNIYIQQHLPATTFTLSWPAALFTATSWVELRLFYLRHDDLLLL